MKKAKFSLLVVSLLLIGMFIVSCAPTGESSGNIGDDLIGVGKGILSVAKLEFLGVSGESAITGFMRLIVVILVFTVIYEVGRRIPALGNTIPLVFALVVSIMTGLFIPGQIFVVIGSSYAIIVALVLLGVPILGGAYALYTIPTTPWQWRLLRLGIIFLLIYLIYLIRLHAMDLVKAVVA